MAKKSIRKTPRRKPAKPYREFSLTANGNGQWSKKIRGKVHYFGRWEDPDAALKRYLEVKDDLHAGRRPRPKDGFTLRDLCNHFLTYKHQRLDSGELELRSFARLRANCGFLITSLGANLLVEDLSPADFQAMRGKMSKRWGPVALANEMQMTRSVFRYGYEAGLLDKPVRFGPGFKKPSAMTIRITRAANGPRMFTPEDIRKSRDSATLNMKAMILLGVNGGLGNTDLGELPIKAVDLETGWLEYPRPKTGRNRRIPLWPESVEAICQVLANRPIPENPENAPLLFIGRRGQDYVGKHKGYRVTAEWNRVARKAGIEGRTFCDFRRTFQTIAEEARDLVAVQAIMGHAPASGDMSAVYRQRISDERLVAVTNYVRKWLFGDSRSEANQATD